MRDLVEKNKILEIITGPYLYGTNTPTSDKDYVGVFMPTEEYVLGFKRVEEVDLSTKNKNDEGKNTTLAIDKKFYEFRKFVKLAMENNPNILEILFVNEENLLYVTPEARELLAMRSMFPYKGLKQKFLGYAFSQKHKMVIKKDNYFDLINALDYVQRFNDGKTILEIVLENSCPHFFAKEYDYRHNVAFIKIGDLNFNPSHTVKTVKRILADRIGKAGNREELLLKYGFDTKFASHLIRLMYEGVELLKTGKLEFPLKERKIILDIKNGKWSVERILTFSSELEKEIETLETTSSLPTSPRSVEIEKFVIKQMRKIL